MSRVIFHVDVNSAFLSWEATYRIHHLGGTLDLRTIPSAVGGDQEKRHGIILAKSIPSKKYHVQTGETVADAKRKCPDLILVPPNYELYNRSSMALMKILKRYSDAIEQYSIDEAFVDMSRMFKNPKETAEELRDTVYNELGFTVNIGVSSNKLLAKMASDFTKPNRVHTLWPEEVPEKMWPLPVGDLFYVGHASEQKLSRMGVHTIGELAQLDPAMLHAHMRSQGLLIGQYANGIDESPIITNPPANKGYGNSLTTPRDVVDLEIAKLYLLSLAETVSARIRSDGVKVKVVCVGVRDYNLSYYNHQIQLPEPTDLTVELYDAACKCFAYLWAGIPLRHLGIHTSGVVASDCRQLNFFSTVDYEKQKKAETTIDVLRRRFGNDSIMRASFAPIPESNQECIDHMGGGISREKRTVDYDKEIIS